jgi:plasmid stability protein
MANLTLRDVPEPLHGWLKQQAKRHRRSVNKEVIELLEGVQRGRTVPASENPEIKRAAIMDISRHCAALPVLDARPEEDILGYDANGIPESSWSSTHPR